MPQCADHFTGKPAPRFLHYESCDDCEEVYHYRIKEAGKRRARVTRENRKTARINGQEPTQMVYSKGFACQLSKEHMWHEPHDWTPKKTRCRRCGRKGKVKVA